MKNICKIAIIFMLLLPAVVQASAYKPIPLYTTTAVDEESLDPSFKEVDFEFKDITIYPHSIVLIRKEATVSSGNKFFTNVEGNVFPGCVRIIEKGATIKEINVKSNFRILTPSATNIFDISKLLKESKGTLVELITSDGFYQGKVLWVLNGFIFLSDAYLQKIFGDKIEERNASYICLKISDIKNIILMEEPDISDMMEPEEREPKADNSPKTRISWEDTGSGSRKVTIIYIVSGISWESKYFLDTFTSFSDGNEDESTLEHWASISNNIGYDLTDVNIRLVAGDIKLENPGNNGGGVEFKMYYAQSLIGDYREDSSSNPDQPSSFSMQEYEVYTLPYKITLKKGETKLIQIQTCDVEIVTEYVYDATHLTPNRNRYRDWENEAAGKVQKILKVKNNGKTWPAGMVTVYQDYMVIGQDGIQWTPKGREAKITIGVASDIEVKKKVTVKKIETENKYDDDYDYTVTITIHNYKDEQVSVKVFDKFVNDALNLASNPDFEEKPGNLMEWKVSLSSDEDKKIVYTYETRD